MSKTQNEPATKVVIVKCPAINDWAPDGVGHCNAAVHVTVSGTDEDGYHIEGWTPCKENHLASAEEPTPWNGGSYSLEDVQRLVDEGEYREVSV